MKDKNGQVLQNEMDIKERWKGYFVELLNVENDRGDLEEIPCREGPLDIISRDEMERALMKMKNDKTQDHLRWQWMKVLGRL